MASTEIPSVSPTPMEGTFRPNTLSAADIAVLVVYFILILAVGVWVDMYAGAVFIQQALGWNIYLAVILLLVITALYTVAGGLAAVIYTDAAQTVIMLTGALTLMSFSFVEVGGWQAIFDGYSNAIPSIRVPNTTCGIPREDAFHIFRDPVTSDFPWPGVLLGMTMPSIWYWCTDQVIVQRSLAAKNLLHAKGGSLLASYLKILPFFMMVLPGMISRILFPDEVGCADPKVCEQVCGNSVGCSDIAYAKLVMELLPKGLRGLMMAVMIAALMSSLTSIFNSSSTLFTMDLWRYLRHAASEWELMIVGRVFVLILVVVSVLWIPLVQASQGGQLFMYLQSISNYLQPPISVVFIAGCFWKRTNEKGAFWGLVLGLLIGVVRMILDFIYPLPQCYETDTRPEIIKYVHYLYFSIILSLFTLVVVVCVSLATEKPTEEQLSRLMWSTRFDPVKRTEAKETGTFNIDNGLHHENEKSDGSVREHTNGSNAQHAETPSKLKSMLLWLCGMELNSEREQPPTPPPEAVVSSLEEEPYLRHVVNANLIVCLSVTVFLFAFWA
ncbi:sodium/myo-inositol cotransporter 2 isoform X2 [Hemibagrus wyckioides]|uniref:sodium/myo-inositol cotransporter 2 isoform X2 n=1 Tax=Hemibagrus wyckioides TaxID=337641 RepID=UPI00266CB2C0|nr:sodium/myo-inositol cotransporter 2 isoform X2 [Hemibagrus wyckioides]